MKIPKQEMPMVSYMFNGIEEYVCTKNSSDKYVLYKCTDGDYKKIKTSDNPLIFDEIIKQDRSK